MNERELLEDYLEMERANYAAFTIPGTNRPRNGLALQQEDARLRISLLKKLLRRLDGEA